MEAMWLSLALYTLSPVTMLPATASKIKDTHMPPARNPDDKDHPGSVGHTYA